jgi:hypothetical protein
VTLYHIVIETPNEQERADIEQAFCRLHSGQLTVDPVSGNHVLVCSECKATMLVSTIQTIKGDDQ